MVFFTRAAFASSNTSGPCFATSRDTPLTSSLDRTLPSVWYTSTSGQDDSRSASARACSWLCARDIRDMGVICEHATSAGSHKVCSGAPVCSGQR
eukprot:366119-Chlamydomonas_euryale.AAC.38